MAETTFESLVERYNAGDKDLTGPTRFVFETQGENTAYDFARAWDEAVGAEPYNQVMNIIATLKDKAKDISFNEQAAAQIELNKQAANQEKLSKQAADKALADAVLYENALPLAPQVSTSKTPLFENPLMSSVTTKAAEKAPVKTDEQKPARKQIVYVVAAVAVLAYIAYNFTKK